ncbi:hypothetical protein [Nodosilinea sp. FACHB-13]|uniref:hypothetical protein n=1 Tax=Cyanophyceae TaxID=3028117 RepID=UPI001689AD9F|nr:hypothetical protein [Nodosilinea sp. FACHB-13]MBD2107046.1 hypothetical protein [Nodosilinea sp. FACHB-13]
MSLFEIVNELKTDQLVSVSNTLGIEKSKKDGDFTEAAKRTHLKRYIKLKLTEFYRFKQEGEFYGSYQILALWRDYTLKIFKKKKVKPENKARQESIIDELERLTSRDDLNDSDRVVSIVRDILLLLWEESSKKEKEKFIDIVKKELEKHNLKFTEDQLKKSMHFLLVGGIGGVAPVAVPLVAGVMLQQLTKGFMGWLLVSVMGQKALQVAVLGAIAGPVGLGIALGTGGLSIALSILKFKRKQDKLRFVQAVLSIYAYRYQNQVEQRRKVS